MRKFSEWASEKLDACVRNCADKAEEQLRAEDSTAGLEEKSHGQKIVENEQVQGKRLWGWAKDNPIKSVLIGLLFVLGIKL